MSIKNKSCQKNVTVVTLVRVVLDPSFDDLATFSHFCNLSSWQLAADRISCFNFHLITFPKIWIIWFYQNSIRLQHKTQNHLYKYTAVKLLESVFKFPISRNLARKPHFHQLPHRQKRKCICQFSSPWNKFSIFIPVERDVIFSCGVPLCKKPQKVAIFSGVICGQKCCILFMYFGLMSLPALLHFHLCKLLPPRFDRRLAWKLEKAQFHDNDAAVREMKCQRAKSLQHYYPEKVWKLKIFGCRLFKL